MMALLDQIGINVQDDENEMFSSITIENYATHVFGLMKNPADETGSPTYTGIIPADKLSLSVTELKAMI